MVVGGCWSRPTTRTHAHFLSTLAADSAGQLDVLGHDGDALGVYCAQIWVLFDTDKACFRSLLGGKDGGSLGAKLFIVSKRDLADETLEGSF